MFDSSGNRWGWEERGGRGWEERGVGGEGREGVGGEGWEERSRRGGRLIVHE